MSERNKQDSAAPPPVGQEPAGRCPCGEETDEECECFGLHRLAHVQANKRREQAGRSSEDLWGLVEKRRVCWWHAEDHLIAIKGPKGPKSHLKKPELDVVEVTEPPGEGWQPLVPGDDYAAVLFQLSEAQARADQGRAELDDALRAIEERFAEVEAERDTANARAESAEWQCALLSETVTEELDRAEAAERRVQLLETALREILYLATRDESPMGRRGPWCGHDSDDDQSAWCIGCKARITLAATTHPEGEGRCPTCGAEEPDLNFVTEWMTEIGAWASEEAVLGGTLTSNNWYRCPDAFHGTAKPDPNAEGGEDG